MLFETVIHVAGRLLYVKQNIINILHCGLQYLLGTVHSLITQSAMREVGQHSQRHNQQRRSLTHYLYTKPVYLQHILYVYK